jgi:HSP20 family protein
MLFAPIVPLGSYARTGSRRPSLHSFERFLDEVMRVPAQGGQSLQQDEKAYTLRFDMPGISREQLMVSIEDAVVRIDTVAEAPRQYRGAYEMPQAIDATSSTATLENGVLTLQLVKLQPVSRATTLTVQ